MKQMQADGDDLVLDSTIPAVHLEEHCLDLYRHAGKELNLSYASHSEDAPSSS